MSYNVGGQRITDTSSSAGEADATNEFIVATAQASTATPSSLADTGEDLRQTLRILGSTAW